MPAKKLFIVIILLLFGFVPHHSKALNAPSASDEKPRLGVWITVFSPEKVLYSRENVDRMIGICAATGITDLYVQVYRADKAYYNSDITDRSEYENILLEAGEDTFSYMIGRAKRSGIRTHAWINLLSLARNENANILKKFGNDILTRDQHGRPSARGNDGDALDNYYIRENQLFLEPGDGRVKDYLVSIAGEIVTKYPGLSGLHLDYIRYPAVVPFIPGSRFTSHGISYGYTEPNIADFNKVTGLDVRTMERSRENFKLWDDWRRKNVTDLVKDISARARALSPGLEISCAVVPSIERAYLVTFQDWTEWLGSGSIDYVVAMNYTDDTKLMELNAGGLLLKGLERRVYIGIGAYLLKDRPEALKEQFASLLAISPAGIVIFSYDDVAESGGFQEFLAANFTPKEAPLPQPS